MSAETQPDPILPNYNPSSWDVPTLSPEERAILDTEYITFPIAQNQNITFPVSPTATTLANGTNTTQVATTGFVQNAITAFLSTVNTWLGTQIFSVGMTSDTINPTTTSGILLIGNAAANTNVEIATSASRSVILHLGDGNNNTNTGGVHIGNGATSANNVRILDGAGSTGTIFLGSATSTISLGCPLTPNYATAYSGTTGTGTGKLGERVVATGTPPLISVGTPQTLVSIPANTLSVGIWLFSTTISRPGSGGYMVSAINTTGATLAGALFVDSVAVGSLSCENANSWLVVVTNVTTVYYLIGQTDINSGGTSSWSGAMFAIRIA